MRSVSSNSRSAWSYATRSAYIAGSRTTAFTSLVRARSSANESFLSETTRTIQGPTSASSRSSWRLVPRPEASTATRAFTPARYGPAVTRVKHERLNPNARIWAVPVDEKSTKSGDRCDLHPASPSVAECQSCGRPLCLACAVPVRGRVLGVECLEAALGPGLPAEVLPARERWTVPWTIVGLAFAVAVGATLLPWTRFGEGSHPLGAWGRTAQWSVLAAIAAALGLSVWLMMRGRRIRPHHPWAIVECLLGAAVTVGATLSTLRPPAFTRPWLGPWIALPAGLLACAAALFTMARAREPHPPRD